MAYIPDDENNRTDIPSNGTEREPSPEPDAADIALEEILRQRRARAAREVESETPETAQTSLAAAAGISPADAETDALADSSAARAGEQADARSRGRRFWDRVLYILSGFVPHKGDSALEIVRKCVFMVALITLIASLSYIINDMAIQPLIGEMNYNTVRELYDPENPVAPPADYDPSNYPEGIMDSFKALYAANSDIRGWMRYSDSSGGWLNIDYPVMYSGDNSYYLDHNFQKAKHKDGALFFDERNHIDSPQSQNKALIIYGHNMASGHMFARLNYYLDAKNGLNYARSAPVISLDTLYERSEYKVFAVMLLNTRQEDGPYFDYLRTDFAGDADFMDFVANIRARSLFDYGDVDVQPDDELLILSTCTAPSGAKFEEGRCAVVARKVRDGESSSVNTGTIIKNEDVIMPQAWYTNQDLDLHPYYTGNFTIPGLWTDGGSTTGSTGTSSTTTGSVTTNESKTTTPPIIVPTPPSTTTTTNVATTTTTTTQPVDPTDPTPPSSDTPTVPTEPEGPTDPAGPVDPTEPTEETTPEEPTNPTEPEEPTEPAEETASEEPSKPTDPAAPASEGDPVEPAVA